MRSVAIDTDSFAAGHLGRLSKRYYNDGRVFTFKEAKYVQFWDEGAGGFRYRHQESGDVLVDNPAVLDKLKHIVVTAFKRVGK